MVAKRQLFIVIAVAALLVGGLVAFGLLHLLPLGLLPIQQKPEQAPQKAHDYYIIIDEENGRTLMTVPIVASVGDELITDENKRYRVVRVEENRAYARFVENVDLQKYRQEEKKKE